MIDKGLPHFYLVPSTQVAHHATLYFQEGDIAAVPRYHYRRLDPTAPISYGVFGAALIDPAAPSIVYGEIVARPDQPVPTGGDKSRLPAPRSATVELYSPDLKIPITYQPQTFSSSPALSFSLPRSVFPEPSPSELDRQHVDLAMPMLNFAWRRGTGGLSSRWTCYFTGTSTLAIGAEGRGRSSRKEPDTILALFEGLERTTFYESNFPRLGLDDSKGLEVALLLMTGLIRDVHMEKLKDPFHFQSAPAPRRGVVPTPAPVVAPVPSVSRTGTSSSGKAAMARQSVPEPVVEPPPQYQRHQVEPRIAVQPPPPPPQSQPQPQPGRQLRHARTHHHLPSGPAPTPAPAAAQRIPSGRETLRPQQSSLFSRFRSGSLTVPAVDSVDPARRRNSTGPPADYCPGRRPSASNGRLQRHSEHNVVSQETEALRRQHGDQAELWRRYAAGAPAPAPSSSHCHPSSHHGGHRSAPACRVSPSTRPAGSVSSSSSSSLSPSPAPGRAHLGVSGIDAIDNMIDRFKVASLQHGLRGKFQSAINLRGDGPGSAPALPPRRTTGVGYGPGS